MGNESAEAISIFSYSFQFTHRWKGDTKERNGRRGGEEEENSRKFPLSPLLAGGTIRAETIKKRGRKKRGGPR